MPRLPKPEKPAYRPDKPKPKLSSDQQSDYKMYNSLLWRNYSKRYRSTCEVCEGEGIHTDITSGAGTRGVVDHIVPIQQGGAIWDTDNHMGMCGTHHNAKRGKEAHGFSVATSQGRDGLVPQDRMDIIDVLLKSNQEPLWI